MKITDIIRLFDEDTVLTVKDNSYCAEIVFSAPIRAIKGKVHYTLLDALDGPAGLADYRKRLLRCMAYYANYSAHSDVSMEDRIFRFSRDVARLEAKEGEVVVIIF